MIPSQYDRRPWWDTKQKNTRLVESDNQVANRLIMFFRFSLHLFLHTKVTLWCDFYLPFITLMLQSHSLSCCETHEDARNTYPKLHSHGLSYFETHEETRNTYPKLHSHSLSCWETREDARNTYPKLHSHI